MVASTGSVAFEAIWRLHRVSLRHRVLAVGADRPRSIGTHEQKPREWVAALAAAAILAGCGGSSSNPNDARVRTFNAVVDSEPLDLLVTDSVLFGAVPAGGLTDYADTDAGVRVLKVRSTLLPR